MRVFVFFDLPVTTSENRRNYARFRKYLINNGFVMMQESVYCRMALNQNAAKIIADNVRRNKPPDGLVQILNVTEKQFSKMEYITGEFKSDFIDSDERLVII
jgi:CRISPR-associated protein Cas2